ncbi:hypothetical protein BU15DRAFT_63868 [Melanogaster broomeanus]|nr:hypothetical protein BU15DRAFT_63868 [Melanogaster broomeanus]
MTITPPRRTHTVPARGPARGPDESTTDQMADGVSLAAPASHPTDGPHDDTAARGLGEGATDQTTSGTSLTVPASSPNECNPPHPRVCRSRGSGIVGRRAATPQMCRELPRAQGTRTARAPANSMTQVRMAKDIVRGQNDPAARNAPEPPETPYHTRQSTTSSRTTQDGTYKSPPSTRA